MFVIKPDIFPYEWAMLIGRKMWSSYNKYKVTSWAEHTVMKVGW